MLSNVQYHFRYVHWPFNKIETTTIFFLSFHSFLSWMRCSEWVGNVNWAWNHIDDIQYFQCCHWLLCSVSFRVYSSHAVWLCALYNVCTILFPTLCPFSRANCGTNAWVRLWCSFGKQPAAFVETWNDDNNFDITWSALVSFVSFSCFCFRF